jgi:hypothetical protein
MDYLNAKIALWNSIQDTQEQTWIAQTARQQTSWQTQTARQETDWQTQTETQETDFRRMYEDMIELYKMLETGSFTLINNNFDDWSVRRGCDKVTVFNADGSIAESITVVAISFLLAEKTTVFEPDGSITETVTFNPWTVTEGNNTVLTTAFTISKRTVFNEDGSIKEEVR